MAKFATIPVGTHVEWHYRSAIGTGTVRGIAKLDTNADNTMYRVEEIDHHVSASGSHEASIVVHSGAALHRIDQATFDLRKRKARQNRDAA